MQHDGRWFRGFVSYLTFASRLLKENEQKKKKKKKKNRNECRE